MTRLAALAIAILGAVVAAAALVRRRVPSYSSWAEYLGDDREGEALAPDPYLSTLTDAGDGRAEVRRG